MGALAPMVGRAAELEVLRECLERAEHGEGGMLLVTGAAGLGKTRVVEALTELAQGRQIATYFGRCWEAGGAPAFWPWLQIVRSMLRKLGPGPLQRVPPRLRLRLAQVLPELAEDAPFPEALEPEHARFQLMDALSLLLCEAAQETPAVLILEDLHSADVSSVRFLEFFEAPIRAANLLLVGTFRPDEARQSGTHRRLLSLARQGKHLPLAALDRRAVQDYVERSTPRGLGAAPPLSEVEWERFYRLTEGHPLFVVELMRLREQLGGFPEPGALPQGVLGTIGERLERLPPSCTELLECAAVLGREFTLTELEPLVNDRSAGTSREQLAEGLEPAKRAQLLTCLGTRHRFSHVLVREVLYRRVSVALRCRFHAIHARAIRRAAHEAPSRWFEAAHHFLESDAVDEALDALENAARAASDSLAFDDAVELLRHALRTARLKQPPRPDVVTELELRLAESLLQAGEVDEGRTLCHRVCERARRRGDPDLARRAALLCGSVYLFAHVDPRLVAVLEAALSMQPEGAVAERSELQARLAAALQPSKFPERPIALAKQAIAAAREVGDPHLLVRVIRPACSAMMDLADPGERAELNEEYLSLCDSLGNPSEAFRGMCRLTFDRFEQGQLERVRRLIAELDARAEQLDHPYHRWRALGFRAAEATFSGRLAEAEAYWDRAEDLGRRCRDRNVERAVASGRIRVARARGDLTDVARLADAVEDAFGDSPYGRVLACGPLAQAGDLAALRTRWRPLDVELSLETCDLPGLIDATWVAVALEDRALAERIIERITPHHRRFVSGGMTSMTFDPPPSRCLALLEGLLGRPAVAAAHYDEVLGELDRVGGWPDLVACALELGRLAAAEAGLEMDACERVRHWLARATPIAEQLRLEREPDELRALSARLGRDTRRDDGPTVGEAPALRLERDGELWCVTYGTESLRLSTTKGLTLLARLVADPGRELHVLDLIGTTEPVDRGDAGPLLDEHAKQRYRARVIELREELTEATRWNDAARAERLRAELDALERELGAAFGLGGRARSSGAASERARVNVQRRLKDAVQRLGRLSPSVGRHLERSVRTGTYCSYRP